MIYAPPELEKHFATLERPRRNDGNGAPEPTARLVLANAGAWPSERAPKGPRTRTSASVTRTAPPISSAVVLDPATGLDNAREQLAGSLGWEVCENDRRTDRDAWLLTKFSGLSDLERGDSAYVVEFRAVRRTEDGTDKAVTVTVRDYGRGNPSRYHCSAEDEDRLIVSGNPEARLETCLACVHWNDWNPGGRRI